ncbi:hypothetical protein BC629DRAFT_944362 [Irpex lacteus]|nr:hypothetical protein BC629DRAFT_944362 [Irpex lacteus]
MTSYKPMILSSQLWLSVLALCFYASEVSAKVHTHYHATTSNKICFDKNHKVIPCPKSKKNLIIGLIIAGSLIGVFVLGGILYCCCCAGEVACATCAACCCLCCGKRKKTSGGQVYQTLPEQGNNATIVSLLPSFHFLIQNHLPVPPVILTSYLLPLIALSHNQPTRPTRCPTTTPLPLPTPHTTLLARREPPPFQVPAHTRSTTPTPP